MKRLSLTVIFCLWAGFAQAAINAQLSDTQVNLDQTFRLLLTQESSQNPGLPNLTVLQKDFNILGTERSVSYTLINGQSSSLSQWTILLEAKRAGKLIIPAISINGQSSKPLNIEVIANSAVQNPAGDTPSAHGKAVRLTAKVNNKQPYVNQEVIYTVKLITGQRLLDADYHGPQVEDALMVPLGTAKRYQAVENNQVFSVEEQRYAIFPQKSGEIAIHSPVFQALVYDVVPKKIRAKDKTIRLKVKAMPATYKGKHWLPAKQVSLSQDFKNALQTYNQGDTLVRTITINSVGAPAQLLPKLQFKSSDNFNVYPEKPEEHNVFRKQQLVGSATIKVTYLFSKAGEITIPELRLPWFNTTTGKEEIAKLPSKTIHVKTGRNPSKTISPLSDTQANQQSEKSLDQSQAPAQAKQSFSIAWTFAIIFAAAWLVTLFLWFWQRRNKDHRKKTTKTAFSALQRACQQNDAEKTRDALLNWARVKWPDAKVLNLSELGAFIRNTQLKKQINLLSKSLYSNNKKTSWQGKELLSCLISLKKRKKAKKSKTNALPPINPV